MWRMTVAVLEELGETGILMSGENLTFLQIYGPNGKMSSYFLESWPSAGAMRRDLMQNHGGGVPIDVIEKLVIASEVIN